MEITNITKLDGCLETERQSCKNCIPQEKLIKNVNLAQAYVPFEKFCSTYMPMESLINGTTFPELNMPYSKHHCCHDSEKHHMEHKKCHEHEKHHMEQHHKCCSHEEYT